MFQEIAAMVLLTQDRKASTEMDNFCEAQSHCVRIEFSQFHLEIEKPQNPYNPVNPVEH